jgi:hypothetical protein
MTFTAISEINSNAQYAPLDFQDDFNKRINSNKTAFFISRWFSNPTLLKSKEQKLGSNTHGQIELDLDDAKLFKTYSSGNDREYKPLTADNIEYLSNKYDLDQRVKNYIQAQDEINSSSNKWNIKRLRTISYTLHSDKYFKTNEKGLHSTTIKYVLRLQHTTRAILPIGLSLRDIYDYNDSLLSSEKFSNSIEKISNKSINKKCMEYNRHNNNKIHSESLDDKLWCFNIITKEFKLLEESKRDYYKKYFTTKPFTAFEECGIEVFYARKGYAIDGKRLPNFNRGSVYGLKYSIKENNFRMKDVGGSKKDDLIRFLLKL